MSLETQTFEQIVKEQVAAIQASSPLLTDFAEGSVLLSLVEANAGGVAIWLQSLIIKLLSTIRALTSEGADLDSWMADYNFTRELALYSTGNVLFSRFTTGQQASIAVGSLVESSVGSIAFAVTADTSNPNYVPSTNSYTLLAGSSSILLPVKAVVAGSSGNVATGAIDTIFGNIPYVDTVTNPADFTDGQDQESDQSFRARFKLYIQSLSKAIKAAIEAALLDFDDNLDFSLTENESYAGVFQPGFFYAVVDDGTGGASPTFLDQIRAVIESVRGLTITYDAYAVVPVNVSISAQITVEEGYIAADLIIDAQTALTNYINDLRIGQGFPYTRVAQIIYNASIGIIDVTGIVLNGGTSDLVVTNKQGLKPLTIVITEA